MGLARSPTRMVVPPAVDEDSFASHLVPHTPHLPLTSAVAAEQSGKDHAGGSEGLEGSVQVDVRLEETRVRAEVGQEQQQILPQAPAEHAGAGAGQNGGRQEQHSHIPLAPDQPPIDALNSGLTEERAASDANYAAPSAPDTRPLRVGSESDASILELSSLEGAGVGDVRGEGTAIGDPPVHMTAEDLAQLPVGDGGDACIVDGHDLVASPLPSAVSAGLTVGWGGSQG